MTMDPLREHPDKAAPRGAVEQCLAAAWAARLGRAPLEVDDDLTALGADRALARGVAERVSEELHVEISPEELLDARTVAAQGRLVESQMLDLVGGRPCADAAPRLAIRPGEREEPFPLTLMQQALWIGRGDAVELGNVGCHGYFEWEDVGLDLDRFCRAWRRLVARHDMLRAVIRPDGRQHVLRDPPPFEIPVLDLRHADTVVLHEKLRRLRDTMSHAYFAPQRWPLFDVRATLLDGDRTRLHLGIDLLILDAWSYYQVLLPDLIWLYEHPDGELEPLHLTFRDYVVSLHETQASTEQYRRSRDYWSRRLPTLPPAPDLPRLPATPGSAPRFTRHALRMAREQWQQLKSLARQASLTPSGVLAGAYAEVLRTWSSGDAFTLNFPLFDRLPLHPQVNRLIGDFTNVCLVPVRWVEGAMVDRMRAVAQEMFTSLEYRHYGGVQVLRELARRDGDASRAAMPVVFNALLGHPRRRYCTPLGREIYAVSQTPQVLIDNQVSELTDGSLAVNWDVQDAAFPPGMVNDMFDAYRDLLARLADGERSWRETHVELVPEAQLATRAVINATSSPIPRALPHELVAERAAREPDRPAVITSTGRLSYGELIGAANRIARVLRELGARPNRLVAIVMDKGTEQFTAVYGVLGSGAAYLPIDPGVPAHRLANQLADGQVRLVLTQSWLASRLTWPESVRVLPVDTYFARLTGVPDAPLPPVQDPTDLAYVIPTSGSTGHPKGVMVDNRGVLNLLCDVNRRFDIGHTDRVFAVSALHFDASVYDTFGPLAAGAAVVLPDPSEHPDPAGWAEQIAAKRITFWNSVPSLLEMLVGHVEGVRGRQLRTLRVAVLSGDWIPLDLPDRLRVLAGDVRVISAGGPTETICWSILHPIGTVDHGRASIPYGRPMSNHRYHVVDSRLRHRPTWVPGEIVSGSEVGLAKGYWRDDERTRAKFRTLPGTAERIYLSGDIGRYLPDGSIEILGREDFQVKIQGYRIELGEIEATLLRHPDIRAAAVLAPTGEDGARRLAAFAVPRVATNGAGPHGLLRFLAERLPAPMVPAGITILDALPHTRNGKVDRRALAELATGTRLARNGFVAPRTPLERVMAGLWAELLSVPHVGARDSFLDLGGDSLVATRLASRLQELFDVPVSMQVFFASPTVTEASEHLLGVARDRDQVLAMADALSRLSTADVERLLGESG